MTPTDCTRHSATLANRAPSTHLAPPANLARPADLLPPPSLAGPAARTTALRVTGGRERLDELLARPLVAIVGSRHCTYYGQDVAGRLSRDLGQAGVTVVAGLTEGIEASAHHGALEAGERTLAVVPGPSDIPYPAGQKHLHAQVLGRGCVVSDAPPGTHPRRSDPLLERNHLIARLAQLVIIVEATVGAAAMQTAEAALELGREVAAVPGRITDESAAGPNRLIRDGAMPVLETKDVLDLLG